MTTPAQTMLDLADEIEKLHKLDARTGVAFKCADNCEMIIAALRSAVPSPHAGVGEITEDMVTAAMRAFERMSSVLRYREKDKWHSCDIMGMRDAIKAALAARPQAEGVGLRRVPVLVPDHNTASGKRVEWLSIEVDSDLAKLLDSCDLPAGDAEHTRPERGGGR